MRHMNVQNHIGRSGRFGFYLLLLTTFYILPTFAQAATLYFYPQQISLMPGEEALVDVRIDTEGESINAVELEGSLSGVAATLRGIDNAGSAIDVFIEQPNIKGKSSFRLVGGIPAGLSGEHLLARVALRGELPGRATLAFVPSAVKVLLADGTGKSVSVDVMSSAVSVLPPSKDYVAITSLTHPDETQWYAATKAQIHFELEPGASYSYVITRDPLEVPDDVADRPGGSAQWQGDLKLDDVPEGITYFAVKKVGSNVVSRYRLMNDVSDPVWLEVKKNAGISETEGRSFLTFLADDQISGIEYYEVHIDSEEPFTALSPQPLPDEYSIIALRAYDQAGNYIEKFIPGPQKNYSAWVWMAILFVLLVWASGIIGKK